MTTIDEIPCLGLQIKGWWDDELAVAAPLPESISSSWTSILIVSCVTVVSFVKKFRVFLIKSMVLCAQNSTLSAFILTKKKSHPHAVSCVLVTFCFFSPLGLRLLSFFSPLVLRNFFKCRRLGVALVALDRNQDFTVITKII